LGSVESSPEAIEAGDGLGGWAGARGCLLDRGARGVVRWERRRTDTSLIGGSGRQRNAQQTCSAALQGCRGSRHPGRPEGLRYLTFHSCSPAETPGFIVISSRSAVVSTGLNVILFHASFAVPNGSVVSTGFHASPSL